MATADTAEEPPPDVPDQVRGDFFPDTSQGEMGMWVFLSSEVLVFGSLIISFLLFRVGNSAWADAQRHTQEWIGTFNTIVLLTSSWSIVMAFKAADQDRDTAANWWMLLTVALGFLFMGVKGYEWSVEIGHGYIPFKPTSEMLQNNEGWELLSTAEYRFWGFYYAITGLHGLHVIGGVIANLLILLGSVFGIIDDNTNHIEYAGLYWHFVDIVWVYLFPIFYLMYPIAQGGH